MQTLAERVVVVEEAAPDYVELQVLSLCRFIIIANSSFSWFFILFYFILFYLFIFILFYLRTASFISLPLYHFWCQTTSNLCNFIIIANSSFSWFL